MALTEVDKVKVALSEASELLHKDTKELKSHVLDNALSTLSDESEVNHETEVVLKEIEKKFPKKSQKDMLALLTSTLLSESEKK